MDYKIKYEQLRKFILDLYPHLSYYCKEKVEGFIPELQEQKDERIRETFIEYVKSWQQGCCKWNSDKDFCNDAIAWLEKQGETISWKPTKEQYEALDYAYNSCSDTETGNYYEGVLETLIEDLHNLEKQGEQDKQHLYDVIVALWDLLDKIDTISDLYIDDTDSDNPFRKIEQITQERHKLVKSNGYDLFIGNCNIINRKKSVSEDEDEEYEEKIAPKFNQGDWVIDNQGIVHQIANVVEIVATNNYCYNIVGGGCFNDDAKGVRLWTIDDAKDGDILVSAGGVIFIFNKVHSIWISCHCSLHKDKSFIDEDYNLMHIKYSKEVYPATKEQRDTLFAKIKEAGYEWDAEKRELRKIEGEPKKTRAIHNV